MNMPKEKLGPMGEEFLEKPRCLECGAELSSYSEKICPECLEAKREYKEESDWKERFRSLLHRAGQRRPDKRRREWYP